MGLKGENNNRLYQHTSVIELMPFTMGPEGFCIISWVSTSQQTLSNIYIQNQVPHCHV